MNNYFNDLFDKFNNLSDEEFDQLLTDSGVEECPYDFSMSSLIRSKNFKEVYEIKVDTDDVRNPKLLECDERKKIA